MSISLDLQTIARALGGEVCGNHVLAPGPRHSLEDRSLSIKLDAAAHDGFIVNSFAGDPPIECKDYVREKIGAEPFKNGHTRPRAINAPAKPKRVAVATYDYRDADGTLLYQTVRYQPKDFRQRQPDGNGGWILRLGDRRVPYRLPELLKYPDATVFVCEGEKDADSVASLGYVATTVASHKWTAECAQGLAGRDCWILEDNDKAGRKNALDAAEALHGYAKSIRIVRLSGLGGGDDVSDWLDAGHTKQEFEHACCTTPLWSPSQKNDQEPVDLGAAFAFLGDAPAAAPQELIRKLLPAFGVAVTGGQSSAGKTFIVIHRTICLGTANPYFGHRIIERVGTVLVAAEGRALIPNRFEAGLVKAGVTKKLPVAWIKHPPDFGSVGGIKLFIAQLREIDKRFRGDFGVRLGHVPIDTVAACFAMKDEDDNAEATKVSNVLADVEVLFRQQFRRDLRSDRFTMEFAQSAPVALQRIADAAGVSLILILSDINMPGMNGLELLPKAKALRPDVPVIMITAYGDAETKRRALESGAEALLTKPIDFKTLRSEIDMRVERAA